MPNLSGFPQCRGSPVLACVSSDFRLGAAFLRAKLMHRLVSSRVRGNAE